MSALDTVSYEVSTSGVTPYKSNGVARGRALSYDGVATSTRRRPPRSDVKSEDDHLNASERRKLVSTTRDLRRNYAIAAWAVRKHLDYVATHSFQSNTGIKDLDDHIERLVKWWSIPRNFDIAKRHGLHRFIRLAEASRTVDGDVLLYKLKTGFLQAIESDRVANNAEAFHSGRYSVSDFKRGIKTSKGGAAQAFIINNRSSTGNRLEFDRVVSAKHIIQFGYFDRFDQIRGISPLAASINTLQDTYEGITYALARAKVSQLFALALKRAGEKPVGEITKGTDKSEDEVDFGGGPLFLDLEIGDEADFLESKQPATEFQEFIQTMISLALKALDIPYSFYAENFTNYSGARQALLMYEQSAANKRRDVQDLLNEITAWRMRLWIIAGVLELPGNMTVSDVKWEWIPTGLPWIDPLKETVADNKAVEGRLNSRTRISRRMGKDWNEVLDELEKEEEELERRGLTKAASTGNAN